MNIKEKFKEVIEYSQGIQRVQVDKAFELWEKNKAYFIKTFGDKLIYECPEEVSIELTEKEKKDRIDFFLNSFDSLEDKYEEDLDSLFCFLSHREVEEFFTNILASDYCYDDNYCIKKGTKISKACKYFVKNKDALREVQDIISRIIQESKITGKLCFSVHPLDFLSLSENASNWTSCHRLLGDFRAGNLSYMLDSSTIIAYIKSNKDEKINNFPFEWNSKKWRMLIFFSQDRTMMFAGRQYPFEGKGIMDLVLKELPLLQKNTYWTYWQNHTISHILFNRSSKENEEKTCELKDKYYPIGIEGLKAKTELIQNGSNLFYNDLLHSSYYTKPYYSFLIYQTDSSWNTPFICCDMEDTIFKIGHPVPCLRCGEMRLESDMDSESFMCSACNYDDSRHIYYCDNCGRAMAEEIEVYDEKEDIILCEQCAKEKENGSKRNNS